MTIFLRTVIIISGVSPTTILHINGTSFSTSLCTIELSIAYVWNREKICSILCKFCDNYKSCYTDPFNCIHTNAAQTSQGLRALFKKLPQWQSQVALVPLLKLWGDLGSPHQDLAVSGDLPRGVTIKGVAAADWFNFLLLWGAINHKS